MRFDVGDRQELLGGTVIECVEVYYEGRRRTGKWVEVQDQESEGRES